MTALGMSLLLYRLALGIPCVLLYTMAAHGVVKAVCIGSNGLTCPPVSCLSCPVPPALAALSPLAIITRYFAGGSDMNDEIVDFIFSRMNDFERLSRNEPSNYTSFETVRFCADILFLFGVEFCCVNGVWLKL